MTSEATGTKAGKRYLCPNCKTEALVTKAGSGTLTCCGAVMTRK